MKEKPWDWEKINNDYWIIPDQYVYYLVNRWSGLNSKSLLDLGCGIGRHSKLFAENDFDVTAVDFSKTALEYIEKFSAADNLNIKTVLSDITSLDLNNDMFDAIIAFNSIYHTDENGFQNVVNEIKRTLKIGGEMFITLLTKEDPSYAEACDSVVDPHTRMKTEEDGSELPHFFVDYFEIESVFEGFKIIEVKQITEFFNSKKHIHYNVLLKLEKK